MKRKLLTALLVTVVAMFALVGVVYAASQPVEWVSNPNQWRYYLSYLGWGYGDCDWNDYAFRINKTFSADPNNYRIYSFNGDVQGAFSGKSPIGHNLETPYDAYLCTGFTDTWSAGGPTNVANHLFVWVQ